MKRLFLLILPLCLLLTLGACGNNQPDNSACEHILGDWVVEKAATCKDEGLLTRSCTKCSYMEATKIEKTNDHIEVIDPEVPATCDKTGLSEGKHCAVCEKVFVAQQETPVVAHAYDDKYDEFCNVCGHIRDAECAHKETEVLEGKAATCTEIGLTDGSKCKKCGEILVAQTVLPVIDHIESGWIVDIDATKTEDGKKHTECTVCGMQMAEDIIQATGSVGLKFSLHYDNQSYFVSGIGTCTDSDIVIPNTYNNLPVTTIGSHAFSSCDSLTSVIIGDSVTYISTRAFYHCSNLTSVIIGDNVTAIGDDAFYWCSSLTSVIIPDSVTTIDKYAFCCCSSLTSVTIPDSVTTISHAAFAECDGLTNVTIPDSVTTIDEYAFSGCDSLADVTIGDSVTTIDEYAFYECGNLTSVTIGDSVTSIGNFAFAECDSLTSVTIPGSVTTIWNRVFDSCDSLTSVTIPDSVNSIGFGVFSSCDSLYRITYKGTISQWGKIAKSSDWNLKAFYYTIYCTDGQISKSGTITYN